LDREGLSALGIAVHPRAGSPARVAGWLDRRSDRTFAWLLFAPGLLVVALFVLPPILSVFGMSLLRIELAKDDTWRFIGTNNFLIRLPLDRDVLTAIPRTVVFAAATTVLSVPLALFAATVLKRRFRGVTIVAIALLLPWAVAPVVTGVFWRFIFTSQFGLANGILELFGQTPTNWLEDSATAIAIATTATAWRSVPLLSLLILAALQAIPDELYRAARMDGAGAWQSFRYVTLPAIRNTLLTVGILQVIIGLQVFDVLFTLTGGGPGRQTYVMVFAIVENAFTLLSFGYAAALSVVLFGLILALSALLLYLRVRRRDRTKPGVETDDIAWRPAARRERLAAARSGTLEAAGAWADLPPSAARRIAFGQPRLPVRLQRAVFVGLVVLLLVWLVGPILWMVVASLQTEGAITAVPLRLRPELNFDGYRRLLTDQTWLRSLGVSLQVAPLTAFFAILLGALIGYPLARLTIPGKGALMAILIFTQMVPAVVMAIPILLMFQAIHLKDTVAALVIVNVAFWTPLVAWLLRNGFEDVPVAIERAARIDGCSRLGTLFRITLPAAAPAISAVAILVIVGTWNEFLFAMILGDQNTVTLTRWISFIESYTTVGQTKQPPYHLLAAGAVLVVLPCLVLVAAFQRRLLKGMTGGLPKG
jgi:ABC-type sugar transport system permease subunit